jgi:hypothetical protein
LDVRLLADHFFELDERSGFDVIGVRENVCELKGRARVRESEARI